MSCDTLAMAIGLPALVFAFLAGLAMLVKANR
jgi:hypothetical protein